jgi:hypothetical protein
MDIKLFYTKLLTYPKGVLFLVLFVVSILASFVNQVEIDASSETLLLKDDKDLLFTREVNKRYGSSDYLVITYTPKEDLLAKKTLDDLATLSKKLQEIPRVTSVVSILNVPLLQDPSKSLKDLVKNIPTLSADTNKTLVKKEFLTSALYKNHLVSSDFKTTALLINLKDDLKYKELLNKRNALLNDKSREEELKKAEIEFKRYRDKVREDTHETIKEIRDVIAQESADNELFLGGVSMIADDMVSFVKSDLKTYGVIVILLIILIMWGVFSEVRFIVLSISILALSVISMVGILGILGLEVTVISSNFVSLQMIITMSLVIHLSIHYKEVLKERPEASHNEIIIESTSSMLKPSFYVILTTIVGFSSLVASGIFPIINLGWMMSAGVFVSLVITFIVFPIGMSFFKKRKYKRTLGDDISITKLMGNWVEVYRGAIDLVTILLVLFSISGATLLIVENSFIDYFKKDTEIYKGMYIIDKKLGGTTPLDVIIDLNDDETLKKEQSSAQADDEFDDFEDEFDEMKNDNRYWFTPNKMKKIEQIHDYLDSLPMVGKVLSFATTIKVGRDIKHGKDLDSLELALLYNELPEEYKNILLKPYISLENNQVRFTLRIIDSMKGLRRDALLKKIQRDIHEKLGIPKKNIRLANMMVMYNNMLQSLFKSQVLTLGIVVVILFIMFLLLFKSLKVAVIASLVNIVPVGVIFGFMGWSGVPLDMMTITIAAISLGIAVDNTIHYLYRFKLEFQKDHNYVEAMHRSHLSIGSAMYYTSLVIITGFSVLTLSSFYPTIHFGLLTMLAMFMAILADLLLLPRLILLVKPFKE